MSDFMSDLTGVLVNQTLETVTAKNSTNTKAGADLEMTDFLQLMVATFQNQSIDDVASTSDMMNQMVQMSVINAVSNLNQLITETTGLSYAASLVGKEVTIGQYIGRDLTTITGTVTGTGMLNGQHVIFIGDESFWLSDVMAVGRIPDSAEASNLDLTAGSGSANTGAGAVENTPTVTYPGQGVTVDEPAKPAEEEALVENGADLTPDLSEIEDAENGEDGLDLEPVDGSESAEQAQEDNSQINDSAEDTDPEIIEITPDEIVEQAAEDIYENSI